MLQLEDASVFTVPLAAAIDRHMLHLFKTSKYKVSKRSLSSL